MQMMKRYKYLILGGGVAAGYAAKEFSQQPGFRGEELAIVSGDDTLPYERPPLSKDFLASDSNVGEILINDPAFYTRHGIDVYLNTSIDRIYTTARALRTEAGDSFSFDNLIIATGARANQFDIPGGDLPHIYYLRQLGDSAAIRQRLQAVEEVVVVGGGYIGLETAAVCIGEGVKVTMVFPGERVMGHRFFTPRLSAFFEEALRAKGVQFIHEDKPIAFQDAGEQVRIKLESGGTLSAGMVIAGIGATPNLQLMKNNQIRVDNGILTDEYLRTNVPGIYAAGDVANFYDVIFEKRRRTEHWHNAVAHGTYLARWLMGVEREPFRALRYFFSDVLDYSYEVWGEIPEADSLVETGNYETGSIGVWWLNRDHVVAALLMGRPDAEREQAQQWIRERKQITTSDLPAVIERQPTG